MAKKTKDTGLYGDQRGRIMCKEHAPLEGSDTWTFDQWKRLTGAEAARFEKEVGRAPACETCVAGGSVPQVVTETATTEVAPVADADAAETKARKPKAKRASAGDVTLEDLAERYLAHLDEVGKSQGTLFSYKLELVTALDELGAKTLLADLTSAQVLGFFISDRVMRTRTGVAKARPTFEKTRRVLRQALVWAEETKLIPKAPVPEDAASH